MRVLVLEDEVLIGLHLAQELRADGHDVLGPAGSHAEANALLDGAEIDFAILDINIHGKAPAALAQNLRERAIPFAYVSGYDEAYIRAHLPPAAFLPKPLQMAALRRLPQNPPTRREAG